LRCSGSVGQRQPLDPVLIRLTCRQLGPFVCDLVAWDPFVRGAPVDLNFDSGFLLAEDRYRLPRLDGVGLAGSGFVVRHPRDCGLRIDEDTYEPCQACVVWPVPLPLPTLVRTPRRIPPGSTHRGSRRTSLYKGNPNRASVLAFPEWTKKN